MAKINSAYAHSLFKGFCKTPARPLLFGLPLRLCYFFFCMSEQDGNAAGQAEAGKILCVSARGCEISFYFILFLNI